MASDSASSSSATETIDQEPMEKKLNDEIMKKEDTENVDVVKDKPTSDSIQIVVKEEQVDQTIIDDNKLTAESKKESPVVVVEEVEAVENYEESAEKKKDAEQVEPGEKVLKECVEEVNAEANFDEEKEEKKETVEDVVEEFKVEKSVEPAEKEGVKIVDVSAEARGKHEDEIKDVDAVSADVEIETTDVKFLEVESKESASEVEVNAEENSGTKEEAEVELQVKLEEKTVGTVCPEEVVLISQDLVSEPEKKSEEVANSSPIDFIEKMSAEAKHVVEESSKNGEEKESKYTYVVNKLVEEEDESVKEDTLKQTDIESKEKETAAKLQEEMNTEKVPEESQTEPDVKESGEAKQESEVTEKEVVVKPKHSNNIISKVKNSLVKAKKAIIGKSTSSKTISTEAKEEIKVK